LLRVRRGRAGVAVALALAFLTTCGSIGDPGPPIAVIGTGSSSLDGVAILTCPDERVLQVTIAQDVGTAISKPGTVYWKVEADDTLFVSRFTTHGPPPEGFRLVVPSSGPITGRVVVLATTTHTSTSGAFRVRPLAIGEMLHSGHVLSINRLPSLTKARCD
jgi:hypothetical protein